MKVVILAGGFGTRLSEHTNKIPKPMVKVAGKPIIWHLMNHYAKFGHKEFIIALGYKSEEIKDYFLNYYNINSDIKVDLSTGEVNHYESTKLDWKVSLIYTGLHTMTGGRLKRLQSLINDDDDDDFLLTYGDGLSDIDINQLIEFHNTHRKLVTITSVRPSARFGELSIDESHKVLRFKEKPQTETGWVNGGFFVMKKEFINQIEGDHTVLENEPLEKIAKMGELMAFKYDGFWQCMDTKRDRDLLNIKWSEILNKANDD